MNRSSRAGCLPRIPLKGERAATDRGAVVECSIYPLSSVSGRCRQGGPERPKSLIRWTSTSNEPHLGSRPCSRSHSGLWSSTTCTTGTDRPFEAVTVCGGWAHPELPLRSMTTMSGPYVSTSPCRSLERRAVFTAQPLRSNKNVASRRKRESLDTTRSCGGRSERTSEGVFGIVSWPEKGSSRSLRRRGSSRPWPRGLTLLRRWDGPALSRRGRSDDFHSL